MTRAEKADQLRTVAQERILVKDGPYGTAIQAYKLDEEGYRNGRSFNLDQKGNNDLLNLTRPDVVSAICNAYVDATAPWGLKKSDPERMAAVLGTLVAAVRMLAEAVVPVIPASAAALIALIDGGRDGTPIAQPTPIFPRL